MSTDRLYIGYALSVHKKAIKAWFKFNKFDKFKNNKEHHERINRILEVLPNMKNITDFTDIIGKEFNYLLYIVKELVKRYPDFNDRLEGKDSKQIFAAKFGEIIYAIQQDYLCGTFKLISVEKQQIQQQINELKNVIFRAEALIKTLQEQL